LIYPAIPGGVFHALKSSATSADKDKWGIPLSPTPFVAPLTNPGLSPGFFMRCYNAAMKQPFQFSLKTLMCVSALVCLDVWCLAHLAARTPPKTTEVVMYAVAAIAVSVLVAR
jgi:hypothetical protein